MVRHDDDDLSSGHRQRNGREDLRERLLVRIHDKQQELDAFLKRARTVSDRLSRITLVSGLVSAVAAGGPGIGGAPLVDSLEELLNVGSSRHVWQVLCVVAAALAALCAVCTSHLRVTELDRDIGKAEESAIELDELLTLVEMERMGLDDAVETFQRVCTRMPVKVTA
ncbi:hypothetical protein Kisp01_71000 [Kineosporia sp. NBRC 101677]|uniref:hypothetical protein n=1 Tax=Kineosporia sp. NBRC 101677 TaxID=3032197 RepID=UPI0024A3FD82|nr:hypothetical protein [Kineosporia sp. NBRC 101677]GLY20086.1 hypothetical protein Kisp01_71000 [Kineosporia sp. NBRC 101677]